MKYLLSAICLSLLLVAVGCNEKKEVKTVEWYTEHPEERKAMVKQCRDNPGELKDDPNCINALQSTVVNSAGSMKDSRWEF